MDTGYKIGCGRYVQEYGVLERAAKEIARYGKRAFVLGGPNGYPKAKERLEASFAAEGMPYAVRIYEEPCNRENAEELAAELTRDGFDVIVGVGGGRVMDMAKLVADRAALPVVNIPTSSATCAAYTPLSVCYSREGKTVGSEKYEHEIDAVLCDMELMRTQPRRLIVSGAYDAMAKLVEINHRRHLLDSDVGLHCSYVLSDFMYQKLLQSVPLCICETPAEREEQALYDTVFLSIVGAGSVSGFARGSNQCAIGHKFYENTRTIFPEASRPYLHGELVAMGLIAQLHYNREADEMESFRKDMKAAGLGVCLSDYGLAHGEEILRQYYDNICDSSAMRGLGDAERARLLECLRVIVR